MTLFGQQTGRQKILNKIVEVFLKSNIINSLLCTVIYLQYQSLRIRIYPFFVSQRFTDLRKLTGKMSYSAAAVYRPDDGDLCDFTH